MLISDLSAAWFEFGLAFTVLGQYESEQNQSHLGRALGSLGHTADKLSVLLNQKADQESRFFLEPLRYYIGVLDAMKDALKVRAELLAKARRAGDEAKACQLRLDNARSHAESTERIALAEAGFIQAQKKVDEEEKALGTVTTRLLEEISNFRNEKSVDFKNFLMDYVKLQIEYSQKTQASWESILNDIQAM